MSLIRSGARGRHITPTVTQSVLTKGDAGTATTTLDVPSPTAYVLIPCVIKTQTANFNFQIYFTIFFTYILIPTFTWPTCLHVYCSIPKWQTITHIFTIPVFIEFHVFVYAFQCSHNKIQLLQRTKESLPALAHTSTPPTVTQDCLPSLWRSHQPTNQPTKVLTKGGDLRIVGLDNRLYL